MASKAIIFLVLCIAYIHCASIQTKKGTQQDEVFSKWLVSSMKNYTQWIKNNRYDPSPIVADFKDLSTSTVNLNISCVINDFRVSGLSQPLDETKLEAFGSLESKEFEIAFEWNHKIVFSGNYVASGVVERIPISGNGKFEIGVSKLVQYFRRGFEITSDGFIDISKNGNLWEMWTGTTFTEDLNFEGLLTGEALQYEASVYGPLWLQFNRLLYDNFEMSGFPGGDTFLEFFTEQFSKTPVADIINQ